MCYASDEIKNYKIALFLIYDEKALYDGNDDDSDGYSDNDDDVKNMFLYTWFVREIWVNYRSFSFRNVLIKLSVVS